MNMDRSKQGAPFVGVLIFHDRWTFGYDLIDSNHPLILLMIIVGVSLLWLALRGDGRASSEKLSPNSKVTKKAYEDIVNSFLHDISFKVPAMSCDTDIKTRVERRMRSQGVSPTVIQQIQVCVQTGVKITNFTYSFASPAVREAIAAYASYVISIDDLTRELLDDLEIYGTNLMLGQSHRHSLLTGLTNHLSEQRQIFGPFGGDMIIKGTLEFISSAKVENQQTENLHLPRDAADYPVYFRAKTGVAEPFAFFCFPEESNPEATDLEKYVAVVPSIMLFLGYVNDILSFYKEEIKSGDSASFMHDHAKLHGISLLQSLSQIKMEAVQVVQKMRNVFAQDKLLLERIEQFIQGYVLYHLSCRRYKLAELNIPDAIEASKRGYQI